MQKTIYLESIGSDVVISRRKGTRNLRISVRSDGRIRLTIPYGVTEYQAKKFLDSKSDWLLKHSKPKQLLRHDMHIGKAHRLLFAISDNENIKTRIKDNEIRISVPEGKYIDDQDVQDKAMQACEKALKIEAGNLLPQRLETLARKYDINYRQVSVKKLKSRWGSCDNRKNIILNIYLMQLEWELIDYVILHELTHTIHQHHQADFWQQLSEYEPNYKELRKEIKSHPTNIFATKF